MPDRPGASLSSGSARPMAVGVDECTAHRSGKAIRDDDDGLVYFTYTIKHFSIVPEGGCNRATVRCGHKGIK